MDWLDPLDTAMMAAEVLTNPMNVGALLILRPPADAGPAFADDIHRAALTAHDPVVAQLRRYPHRGVQTAGCWVWRQADSIDLSKHCARWTLPPGSGPAELWQLIGRLHAEPFDRSRPMWMSYVIDGFGAGRFAFYVKIHHTVMDGVAGFGLIADALSPDPMRRSMPQFYAAAPDESEPRETEGRAQRATAHPLLRSLTKTAASGLSLLQRVVTGEASTVMAALTGDAAGPLLAAPYTRFNARLGHDRVVSGASWPRERFRRIQLRVGVTCNDVVTAVVSGVLRSWLIDREELPGQSLVAICPITVRSREHPADRQGNMFGAWLCPLGTDLASPAERLDLIHRSMAEGKHQVAHCGSGASMLLLATAIGPTVLPPMVPFAPKIRTGYNLPVSHVPGPRAEMYWNGAHVEEIYPVSAVYDGQALNVTTCSYADRIGFGYVAGSEVVPDIESLVALTEQSLRELEVAMGVRTMSAGGMT